MKCPSRHGGNEVSSVACVCLCVCGGVCVCVCGREWERVEHVMSVFVNVGLPPLDDAVIHSRIKLFITFFFSIGIQHGIVFGLVDY